MMDKETGTDMYNRAMEIINRKFPRDLSKVRTVTPKIR